MEHADWPIVGQGPAIRYFEQLLAYERRKAGRIGGNFILSGPSGVGKKALLAEFLRRLLNLDSQGTELATLSPDIVELVRLPEKREIGVAQARVFAAQLSLSALAGPYRVGIVHEAELLSIEAANALLKALEDAREQVLVFFITTAADKLPLTICSRSQTISFGPVPADAMYDWLVAQKLNRPLAKNLARLSEGKPELALELAGDKKALENRLAPAKLLCAAVSSTLAERWQASGKLLGTAKGAEAVEKAQAILNGWRLAVRDLILMRLNRPELAVHATLDQELSAILPRLTLTDLRRLNRQIEQAGTYLVSNVSPKLVLEQALMSI